MKTDTYFPNNTSSQTRILIFWYDEGRFAGSKNDAKNLGTRLANASFMTLIPSYRSAPASTFPAAHQDSKKFVEWLLEPKYTNENDRQNIMQVSTSVGGILATYLAGIYGFPTVTWSTSVDSSSWTKTHPSVIPPGYGANELEFTNLHDIFESSYKFFVLTYTGKDDQITYKQMDTENCDLNNLGRLKTINSTYELVPLDGVLKFVDFLASHNHEIGLLVIKGHHHAMDYAKDYLDESLDFLF